MGSRSYPFSPTFIHSSCTTRPSFSSSAVPFSVSLLARFPLRECDSSSYICPRCLAASSLCSFCCVDLPGRRLFSFRVRSSFLRPRDFRALYGFVVFFSLSFSCLRISAFLAEIERRIAFWRSLSSWWKRRSRALLQRNKKKTMGTRSVVVCASPEWNITNTHVCAKEELQASQVRESAAKCSVNGAFNEIASNSSGASPRKRIRHYFYGLSRIAQEAS